MERMIGVINITLPILLMVGIGYMVKLKKIMTPMEINGLKNLVIKITLPVVLFKAFYRAEYGTTLLICFVTIFITSLLALLIGKVVKRLLHIKYQYMPYLMTGFEAGMMGYALYIMLFGERMVVNFAMVDLGQAIFIFTVYMALVKGEQGKKESGRDLLQEMLTTPILIGILIGVVVGVTGIGKLLYGSPIGSIVEASLGFIGAPTAAVILLAVGYDLECSMKNIKGALQVVFLRLGLMGILVTLLITFLGNVMEMQATLKGALLLLFILPPPFILSAFVEDEEEKKYIATTLSLYTIVSIIAFAGIAFFIG